MNTSAIVSFLKDKVGLFRDISAERLQSLVEGSRVGSFEANETILHQGDEATHFGVVLSGTIDVSVARRRRRAAVARPIARPATRSTRWR